MEAASARYAGGYASRDRFGAFGEPANSTLQRYICSFLTLDLLGGSAERYHRQRLRSPKYGAQPRPELGGFRSHKLEKGQCVRLQYTSDSKIPD